LVNDDRISIHHIAQRPAFLPTAFIFHERRGAMVKLPLSMSRIFSGRGDADEPGVKQPPATSSRSEVEEEFQ
jgi:hypothetical protein